MFRSYLAFGLQLFVILIVCYADKSTTSKSVQKCRDYSAQVYGEAVPNCENSSGNCGVIGIQQFPYIALLGYQNDKDESINWQCHGTLVSSRYVLTVANCLRNPRATLTKVRLGATSNGYKDEINSADYDVEEYIVNSLYKASAQYNNVGLIKLSRKVEFSVNVRPICLPDSDLQSNTLFQVNYESSKSNNPPQRPLTKYEYNFVSNEDCNQAYLPFNSRQLRKGITDELLCSTKSSNTSSDYSCLGESGAPLYIDHAEVPCSHIQLGISSFGGGCGSVVPDVATKVHYFSEWIESNIWPDSEDLK